MVRPALRLSRGPKRTLCTRIRPTRVSQTELPVPGLSKGFQNSSAGAVVISKKLRRVPGRPFVGVRRKLESNFASIELGNGVKIEGQTYHSQACFANAPPI
jgi:hypothetical protein